MTNFSELSRAMADVVEAASESVVQVRAARPVSGTVIGEGLILTAAHVLPTDEVTVVTAGGVRWGAVVAGRDPATDLALLRVPGLGVPALAPGEEARVGELLLAVGRPPHGVQAALGLYGLGAPARGPGHGWLPSGAAPFPASSGGALVGADGTLVGVLNAGVRRGELLAVPAGRALRVAALLDAQGRVPRGYLGLSAQPVHFPDTQPMSGAAESGVAGNEAAGNEAARGPRGPWERGPWGRGPWERGHRGGPGREGGHEGGRGRGGPRGPRGPWGPGGWQPGGWTQGGRMGLTVVQVDADGPAAQAGVLVGDVLLALDGAPVRHPRELLERVRDQAGQTVTLRVLRGGQEQELPVPVGER
ncbi:S1C family serine protease [Deinococcus seoulensis]|nr:S1C family serine protease [Deinococcus seoulensis]